jgi:hypothetical protein
MSKLAIVWTENGFTMGRLSDVPSNWPNAKSHLPVWRVVAFLESKGYAVHVY